ncbi:COG1361 S-layer family protein [Candidatus Woesearchaeota archaeon]|nr:COG1361 S-layer family protein [Candidatus Woesearchaeota archaeon]
MNKLLIVLVLFILSAGFVWAAEKPGGVKITLINQEPDPVGPGEYLTLRFKIENLGTKPISNLYVKLDPSYPFSLDNPEDAIKFVGNLWGGLEGDYGVVVKYSVRVADDAAEGVNKIRLEYKSDESNLWTELEFDVNVRAIFDQVFVKEIDVEPEVIHAGDEANITFTLVNLGDTTMKDITLGLDFTSASIPFVPYTELSEKRIKTLKPGQVGKLRFRIRADPNADSKLYKIPVTLQYTDMINNKYTKSDVLGLEIGGKPSLLVELEESAVLTPGSTGEIVISIVNNGETDVKFLEVVVGESEEYVLIEGATQYIGNLDSDDYETVKVKLHLRSNSTRFELPVSLRYKDSLGNSYTHTATLKVPFFTSEEAIKYGLVKKSRTTGALVTIVIIVVGLLIYRFFKRRRAVPA